MEKEISTNFQEVTVEEASRATLSELFDQDLILRAGDVIEVVKKADADAPILLKDVKSNFVNTKTGLPPMGIKMKITRGSDIIYFVLFPNTWFKTLQPVKDDGDGFIVNDGSQIKVYSFANAQLAKDVEEVRMQSKDTAEWAQKFFEKFKTTKFNVDSADTKNGLFKGFYKDEEGARKPSPYRKHCKMAYNAVVLK